MNYRTIVADPPWDHSHGTGTTLVEGLSFQQAYGVGGRGARYYRRWGTADHWPRFRQIHMAYRGWKARGWQPWPTTSVYCGLR